MNSQPARLSLQRTALEEANVMIGILQNDLASLETVMKGKDPFNKVMSLVQLPVDTPGYALVQTVVGINDRLAEQRAVPTKRRGCASPVSCTSAWMPRSETRVSALTAARYRMDVLGFVFDIRMGPPGEFIRLGKSKKSP